MKPKKNDFCYSLKNWDIVPESKKVFKSFVLDAIEACKDDLSAFEGMDKVYFKEDGALPKFNTKNQLVLLDRLRDAVEGKPFIGMSSTSDYVLEELLHKVITVHTTIMLDMEKDSPYAKKAAQQIREVYRLNTEDPKKIDNSKLLKWVEEDLWQDIDWASFPVDAKEYQRTYLSNKAQRGPVKDLPIINI